MPKWYGGSALNPDEIISPENQWKLQWHRVIRWSQRSAEIKKKSESCELDSYDTDVVIAFFQNCYHLRDWIRSSQPSLTEKLDRFFVEHFEMGACRDICNGYKHKMINRPSHDPDFNLYREYDYFFAEANPSKSPVFYRVAFEYGDDIKMYDLFDLAEKCLHLWEDFVSKEMSTN